MPTALIERLVRSELAINEKFKSLMNIFRTDKEKARELFEEIYSEGKDSLATKVIKSEEPDLIEMLASQGINEMYNFNAPIPSVEKETILVVLTRYNNITQIRNLISRGADVNARLPYLGKTALHILAQERANPDIVLLLLQSGADVNIKDYRGGTPILYAEDRTVIKLLLEYGADIPADLKYNLTYEDCVRDIVKEIDSDFCEKKELSVADLRIALFLHKNHSYESIKVKFDHKIDDLVKDLDSIKRKVA